AATLSRLAAAVWSGFPSSRAIRPRRSSVGLGIGPDGMKIRGRPIGDDSPPLVIAEIGINHEGNPAKARRMIEDAAAAGCECVKFQCHVIEDEMIPAAGAVVPGNATESILAIMERCALSEADDRALKAHAEERGLIYLSTPFSRAAADRLEAMD